MKPQEKFLSALRKVAMGYSDVEKGVACKGTVIECSTFKVNKKAFLFVGTKDARLKLHESLPEAKKLAAKEPDQIQVGASGWVKVTFSEDAPLPLDVLKRWVGESYRLMAPHARNLNSRKKTKVTSRRQTK